MRPVLQYLVGTALASNASGDYGSAKIGGGAIGHDVRHVSPNSCRRNRPPPTGKPSPRRAPKRGRDVFSRRCIGCAASLFIPFDPDGAQDAQYLYRSARFRVLLEVLARIHMGEKCLVFLEDLAMQAYLVALLQRRYRLGGPT